MSSISKTQIESAIRAWLVGSGNNGSVQRTANQILDVVDEELWDSIHAQAMKMFRVVSELEEEVKKREAKLKELEPTMAALMEIKDDRAREAIKLACALKQVLKDTDADTAKQISYAVYGFLNGNTQTKSIPVEGEKDYYYPMMNEPEV